MNEDNKPVINPQMNDYTQDKGKNFKIAIVLTVVLIVTIVILGISMNNMLKQANHYVEDDDKTTEVVDNKTTKETGKVTSNITELSDLFIIDVDNNLSGNNDLFLSFNTYASGELVNTFDYEIYAIGTGEKTKFIVNKADIGVYDKYDYKINHKKTIYKSLLSEEVGLNKDYTINDNQITYIANNQTGKSITRLSIVTLFYDSNSKIVDAKFGSTYGIKETGEVKVLNSSKEYDKAEAVIVEAYTV